MSAKLTEWSQHFPHFQDEKFFTCIIRTYFRVLFLPSFVLACVRVVSISSFLPRRALCVWLLSHREFFFIYPVALFPKKANPLVMTFCTNICLGIVERTRGPRRIKLTSTECIKIVYIVKQTRFVTNLFL